MTTIQGTLNVNEIGHELHINPRVTLLDVLRDHLTRTGTASSKIRKLL